ncbi:MAG TPA: hypothetical protein PLP26_15530 [Ilumatobacteraceae bacterium]|nr:hypothetical protein [Ilumatobacteraceae bacterium]
MHSRTLDRAGRLADELMIDALFIVRRKSWHWPAVALGVALGGLVGHAVDSAAIGSPGLFVAFGILIGGGLGLNAGSDFRFIGRSATRVLLFESSRVIGLPTELVGEVDASAVHFESSGPALRLTIGYEHHVMARQHAARLRRMLQAAR